MVEKQQPGLTARAEAEAAARREREAAALRANLRRRKAQVVVRETTAADETAPLIPSTTPSPSGRG